DLPLVTHDDQRSLVRLDHLELAEADRARDLGLDARLLDDAARHASDVERPEGKLGARLADRLRRDDAGRLAQLDHAARREIPSVALAADAARGLALQDRPDRHLL